MEIGEKKSVAVRFDVAVIGGGISGLVAAIASARHGARTALVQNRPVLGGNASGEIRMHICGAAVSGMRDNARETGILEEILLENRKRNYYDEFSIFDMIMWEKARFQDNLTLFMNTHMYDVETSGDSIVTVNCTQLTTETDIRIEADYFIDATGDGTLGAYAGAGYMKGSESSDDFGETIAPAGRDDYTMGNTILFKARDTGRKVGFIKPDWAYEVTDEMLATRDHSQISYGYWWIELGGMEQDTIKDNEEIKDELMKWAYGIWDHIKNKGDHGAGNYDLVWVGALPGKRESRRLRGAYVLKAQDLLEGRVFKDAVAYGGWPMDMHVPGGLKAAGDEPTKYFHLEDMYTIPYRCLYSEDVRNLFLAGRAISASKLAFGSIRVMGTTGVIGQAVGTAAAKACEKGVSPEEVMDYIDDLQLELMKDDCYIHGYRYIDPADRAKDSKISCSSEKQPCINVINGHTRNIGDSINYWESDTLSAPEYIEFGFDKPVPVKEIRILFDSNLTREIRPSMDYGANRRQIRGVPAELVRAYDVILRKDGRDISTVSVNDNYQRLNVHCFNMQEADSVRISVRETNGLSKARIFDVKIY